MINHLDTENVNLTPPFIAEGFPYKIAMAEVAGKKFVFRPEEPDVNLMKSIFQFQEYALPLKNFSPKLILDCGGNIGCAAVYFANVYPNSKIYSIEPEKNNFKLLKYNTSQYKNITPINSAVWDKETFIRVEDKGYGTWGFMTFETAKDDPAAFTTVTVSKLLKESGCNEIDLLKVDIEGAEKEVFGAVDVDEWLSKVNVITIELHDRMKLGCSYEFFKAISKYRWFFTMKGENLIFIRESMLVK